jgi:hypothetical protein
MVSIVVSVIILSPAPPPCSSTSRVKVMVDPHRALANTSFATASPSSIFRLSAAAARALFDRRDQPRDADPCRPRNVRVVGDGRDLFGLGRSRGEASGARRAQGSGLSRARARSNTVGFGLAIEPETLDRPT